MDFQSVNPLNVRLNMISGNLLPMTAGNASFPILWRIYSVLMWLLQIVIVIALIPGCIYVPREKALKDGMICFAIAAEMFFMITRLHAYRNVVGRLIQRINDILRVADDTMRNIVTATLQPVQAPLKFYWIAGMISIVGWNCIPLMLLLEKMVFIYSLGAIVQLYIFCSCLQQLSDASTQLTDEAFHQEWYMSGMWIKKIFLFLIVANNLGCDLATIGNFNLTLPAFLTILNQAYSFALVFLRIR